MLRRIATTAPRALSATLATPTRPLPHPRPAAATAPAVNARRSYHEKDMSFSSFHPLTLS